MPNSNRGFALLVSSLMLVVVGSTTQDAHSQTCTFTRTAKSDSNVTPVSPPQSLQNGDFKIVGFSGNSGDVGDGIDEFTRWIYDYKSDLDIINLLDPAKMSKANLDVVYEGGGDNDEISIRGLNEILAFPAGVNPNGSYNLLSHYTPQSIIDQINAVQTSSSTGTTAQEGELLMGYQDDALLTSATLELVFDQECPVICTTSKRAFAGSEINWKNAAGGAFAVGTNWEGDQRPGPDSIAVFGIGNQTYSVTFDDDKSNARVDVDGDFSVLELNENSYTLTSATRDFTGGGCSAPESILVHGNLGRSSSLVIADGTILASGDVVVGMDGPEHTQLTVSGDSANLIVDHTADLRVGSEPGSDGNILVELGATLVTNFTAQFGFDATSSGWITVDGPTSNWSAQLASIGLSGIGEGRVTNGASLTATTFDLAKLNGSSGSVIVSDSGSVLTIGSDINIGGDGQGTLTIENGGKLEGLSAAFVRVGHGDLGEGILNVQGQGSILDIDGIVEVGRSSKGTLDILDGASAMVRNLAVGQLDSGFVTIDGQGTNFNILDDSFETKIGETGSGRASITNGAVLESAGDIHVGAESQTDTESGLGTLNVLGAGSRVAARTIFIGVKSVGEVYVDSAIVSLSQGIAVGVEDFKQDTTPSRLELAHGAEISASDLAVGGGHGVVRIRSGSAIGVQNAIVARNGTSDGQIYVEDPGSELLVIGRMVLGDGGTALLNVFSGGSATIGTLKVGNGTIIGSNLTVHRRVNKKSGGAAPNEIETEALYLGEGAILDVAEVELGAGGIIGGSGSYPFPLVNGGEISPGDSALTTATMQLDSSYVQLESGSLRIELGGENEAEFDRLVVAGKAELSGKLILEVIEIPEIAVGTGLEIVSADSISGTFSEVEVGPGLAVNVEYGTTSVTIRITAPVSVEDGDIGGEVARTFRLDANYPNPFAELTTIPYSIPAPAQVDIELVDLLGRIVQQVDLGMKQPGDHVFILRRNGLLAGVYYLRLTAGAHSATQKMTLLR